MANILWLFPSLVAVLFFLGSIFNKNAMVQEKAEVSNTRSLGIPTWYCVARPDASPADLQISLDWACGWGTADCKPIQWGGPCFEPNTLTFHASYAFNSYFHQNANHRGVCNFRGTATITQNNPSFGNCTYPSSGSYIPSAASPSKYRGKHFWWNIGALIPIIGYRFM